MNVQPDFLLWGRIKERYEGCKLSAYLDSGKVPTIGFGTTYRHDLKRKVKIGDKITFQQAVTYWEIDSAEVVRLANVYIHKPLNAAQSTAVCDYIYNRGIGNFLKVTYKGWGLDELINADPSDARISEIIKNTGWWDRLNVFRQGLAWRRATGELLYRRGILKLDWTR